MKAILAILTLKTSQNELINTDQARLVQKESLRSPPNRKRLHFRMKVVWNNLMLQV